MKSNKDFGGAVFLIFLGTIFLLNTTGTVGWGIWEYILAFWPILIVLMGLKLIIGESLIARIILGIISLIVYTSIGFISFYSYSKTNSELFPYDIIRNVGEHYDFNVNRDYKEEETIIKEVDHLGIEKRNLNIDVGASKFTLVEDKELSDYLKLQSKYVPGYIEPNLTANDSEKELTISFRTETQRKMFRFRNDISSTFDLTIGLPNILTSLDIDLGAGEGDITLNRTLLDTVTVRVGAGDLDMSLLDFSVPKTMDLSIGAANMNLTIPKEIGYELTYTLGVGDISENGKSIASFVSKEDTYKSSNYDSAKKKLSITTDVGVGSLNIVTK